MQLIIAGLLASGLYLLATGCQIQQMRGKGDLKQVVKGLGLAAALCQGYTRYLDFSSSVGIDLGIYPMLSLSSLSIVVILLLSSLRRQLDNLFVVVFPLAALAVLVEISFQGSYAPREHIATGILSHIIFSVVAYSLLSIAAAQALLLSFGDRHLRHRDLALIRNLPPLETMEQLMFELLWVGLVFLTLSIGSGFLFLEDLSSAGLIHHTVITLAAWGVFAALMWGRYQRGWRGTVASRWVLLGFALLLIGYFGSKLVLEIILGRA